MDRIVGFERFGPSKKGDPLLQGLGVGRGKKLPIARIAYQVVLIVILDLLVWADDPVLVKVNPPLPVRVPHQNVFNPRIRRNHDGSSSPMVIGRNQKKLCDFMTIGAYRKWGWNLANDFKGLG